MKFTVEQWTVIYNSLNDTLEKLEEEHIDLTHKLNFISQNGEIEDYGTRCLQEDIDENLQQQAIVEAIFKKLRLYLRS